MIKQLNDANEYTKLWLQTDGSLNQSWQWSQTRQSSYEIHRLAINDVPFVVYVRSLPLISKRFGYIPRMNARLCTTSQLKQIQTWSKELSLTHIIIEPEVPLADFDHEISDHFRTNQPTIQPMQTMVNDLSVDADSALKNMKTKHRQYIRKAERNGVEYLSDNSREGFKEFYSVMESIIDRTGMVMHDKAYFERIFDSFNGSDFYSIELAKQDGKAIAGLFSFQNNSTRYEWTGGATDHGMRQKAGYGLKWYAMNQARKQGQKWYDHWGVAPKIDGQYDKNSSMFNISVYKEGFGGNYLELAPQVIIENSALVARGVQLATSTHKSILKLRKKYAR